MQTNASRRDKTATRRSNLELLRIVAMLLIIAHHFAVYGGFAYPYEELPANRLWIQFLSAGGKLGANLFVMISGYFLIGTEKPKTEKVLRFWVQLFTTGLIIFAIFNLTGLVAFDPAELIKRIFPVTFLRWWFASSYFVLLLLVPFVNRLLRALDRDTYRRLLALLTVLWSVIPTFLQNAYQCNFLLWFLFLYAFAGYLRRFEPDKNTKAGRWAGLSLLTAALIFASIVLLDLLGRTRYVFAENATYFCDMQRLPVLCLTLFLFLAFLHLDLGSNRVINTIAGATFGVYLLHDDEYVRPWLWEKLLNTARYTNSSALIPISLGILLGVFGACICIELLRLYTLEKLTAPLVSKLAAGIDAVKEKFFSSRFFDNSER